MERELTYAQTLKFVKSAWLERDKIFQELFGQPSYATPDTYRPPELIFNLDEIKDLENEDKIETIINDNNKSIFKDQELNILAYGPDPLRPYWLYVTSGLSTPWLSTCKEEVSGYGFELAIKSPIDAMWPVNILRTLALHVLNHSGVFSPGATLDLKSSIDSYSNSDLDNLFVWYLDEASDAWYELPSGGFGLFCCIGISTNEMKYLRTQKDYGAWTMQELLRRTQNNQVTNPSRKCIMKHKNIKALKQEMKIYLRNFSEFSAKQQLD